MPTPKVPARSAPRSRKAGRHDPAQLWPAADAEARRRLIVDLALDLLRDRGLAAVTMRNVAGQLRVGTMTLYTYVEGQHGLHREMVKRGFEMLHGHCKNTHAPESSTAPASADAANLPVVGCAAGMGECKWAQGARAYLRFAVENPGLYKLMFDHPMTSDDRDLMAGGFQPLLDKVTDQLIQQGWTQLADLPREARRGAGRFWITLHGVSMLAIAGRLCVLEGGIEEVLADLLPRVAPT